MQKYKQSEIGELPDKWEVRKLGDIVVLCQYGLSTKLSRNGQYPVFRMNNIENGKVVANDLKYVNLNKEVFEQFKLEKGDILFNRTNSYDLVGKVGIFLLDGNYTFASYLIRIRANNQLSNPLFLNYYLNSEGIQDRFRNLATRGVSQSNINSVNLRSIDVAVPTLKEQTQIASILSKVDDLIHKTEEIIEQTQRLKKGVMHQLLTRGIGHTKFKKTALGEVPEGWNIFTIQELKEMDTIYELQDGNHGELYPNKKHFSTVGKPFLTANSIRNGKVYYNEAPKLPEEFYKRLRIGFAKPGDVLFTHNATVGRVAILPEEAGNCIIGTSVTYYRLNTNKINREYFAYALASPFFKRQLNSIMFQTTRTQVPITKQAKLRLVVPPLEEQQKIASILSILDKKSQLEVGKSDSLKDIKKWLMQKLLTGKIRVKV